MTQSKTLKIDGVEYVRAYEIQTKPECFDGMDYCIVRSREQGVMCGYVESINGRTVKLHQARQMWRYDSYFVLPDIAEKGLRDPEKCRFSVAMSQPAYMTEACGILTCTDKAADDLISVKEESNDA